MFGSINVEKIAIKVDDKLSGRGEEEDKEGEEKMIASLSSQKSRSRSFRRSRSLDPKRVRSLSGSRQDAGSPMKSKTHAKHNPHHLHFRVKILMPTISDEMRKKKSSVYYPIVITEHRFRYERTLLKRYTDFSNLQKKVISLCHKDGRTDGYALGLAIRQIPFPAKEVFEGRYHPDLIQRRKRMFQQFLIDLLRWSSSEMFCVRLRKQIAAVVEGFLGISAILSPPKGKPPAPAPQPGLLPIVEKENESTCSSEGTFGETPLWNLQIKSYSIRVEGKGRGQAERETDPSEDDKQGGGGGISPVSRPRRHTLAGSAT